MLQRRREYKTKCEWKKAGNKKNRVRRTERQRSIKEWERGGYKNNSMIV